jgi:hypothetical protein
VQYLPHVEPESPPRKNKTFNKRKMLKQDDESSSRSSVSPGSVVSSLLDDVSPFCSDLLPLVSDGTVAGEEASIDVLYKGPVRVADRLCDTWGEFDGTEPAGDGLMSRLLI